MNDPMSRPHSFVDDCRDHRMIRRMVALYDTFFIGGRERARRVRPDAWIGRRAIEVDEKPAYRRDREWSVQARGEVTRHDERASVITAVAAQNRLPSPKKTGVLPRDAIAAMFAGYYDEITHDVFTNRTAGASPDKVRQLAEHLACALAPTAMERCEVWIAIVEAAPHVDLEAVSLIADKVDRHPDRNIAAHRRVE